MPEVAFNLEWDVTGQHWMETGVDRGVIYPIKADGTYDDGQAWSGLRTFDENPEGAEPQEFYADNIKYCTLMSAEKYKFDIGCYTYPPVWATCNGFVSPIDGVNLGQQARKGFGFTCRTKLVSDTVGEGDGKYIIHIVYNALASPSQKSYETINETPSGIELSYSCTSTPVSAGSYKPVSSIDIDTRYLSAEKLTLLEKTLYGTAAVEGGAAAVPAYLPTPTELLTLLS